MKVYEKKGEWSGYTIREGKTGFIIEYWSMVQGGVNGRKVLVKYDEYAKGEDLTRRYNNVAEYGEMLAGYGKQHADKVLRKGNKVQ